MQMRDFHCPVCQLKLTIPKTKNFKRTTYKGKKHRKTMYCPICGQEQLFILDSFTHLTLRCK